MPKKPSAPTALSRADQHWLAGLTDQIRGLAARVSTDLIQIGRIILQAKARLPHGAFTAWCEQELPWSPATILRFARAAEVFAPVKSATVADSGPRAKNVKLTNSAPIPKHVNRIEPAALHVLSAPSCPPEAVARAVAAAKAGERVTYSRARAIVAEVKGEPRRRETSPPPGQDLYADRLDAMFATGKIRLSGDPCEPTAAFLTLTHAEYQLLLHCLFPENYPGERPLPAPTGSAPGSDARLKEMLRRASKGLALTHPDDAAPGKNGETRTLVIVNRSGGAGQVTSDGRDPPPPKAVCWEGEEDAPENRKWFRARPGGKKT